MVAVKPELHNGSVFGHEVRDGFLVLGFVGAGREALRFNHPVPGGQVDTQFHAVFVAGVAHGLHYVRVIGTARIGDVSGALRIVPEAEAVVVLGGKDDLLETVVGRYFHPLVGIDGDGLVIGQEQALAPGFSVTVGILAVPAAEGGLPVVVEHQQFLPLPGYLPFRGNDSIGGGCTGIGRSAGFLRVHGFDRSPAHFDGAGCRETAVRRGYRDGGVALGQGTGLAAFGVDGDDFRLVAAPADAGVGGVGRAHAGYQFEVVTRSKLHFAAGEGYPGNGNTLFGGFVFGLRGAGASHGHYDGQGSDGGIDSHYGFKVKL